MSKVDQRTLQRLEAAVQDAVLFTDDERDAVREQVLSYEEESRLRTQEADVERLRRESEAQRLIDARLKILDRTFEDVDPPAKLLEIFVARHRELEMERERVGSDE